VHVPVNVAVRAFCLSLLLFAIGCGGDLPPIGNGDLAGVGDGGGGPSDMSLLPLGTPCMTNAQCQSNICFVGGKQSFCTLHCTQATVATDCPVPPTSGMCNMQGYCKFP
jgi:hypothetical protein